jgi:DDE superfamily endonuclease
MDREGALGVSTRVNRIRLANYRSLAPFIAQEIDNNPFASSEELVRRIAEFFGIRVSVSTVVRARKHAGFRFKLARRSQQHQKAHPDHPFMRYLGVYDGAIAVDEASFVSADLPRRGWAHGSSHVPKPPPTQRRRVSVLLALDANGVVGHDIRSGSFNARTYGDFLKTLPAGRRVIADNVSFHKTASVRNAASDRDQELVFTPPYCPWFNPVEFAFSLTKRAYRRSRLEGSPNFVDDVQSALTKLDMRTCTAFFAHARSNMDHEVLAAPHQMDAFNAKEA